MSDLTTFDDVLQELDNIVETTIEDNSLHGIFAWVYRRTTAKIAKGARENRFDDPIRMEKFDVAFARRYIDAFHHSREGKPVSLSWKVAFNEAENRDSIIMQHLLLGMNAHINLDLGITAAGIAPGSQIVELKNDFMLVNTLLSELVDEIQQRISRVSPLMFLLDLIGERTDEAIVNFSIEKARGFAWKLAQRLAHTGQIEREEIIAGVDEEISSLGNLVANPPGFLLPKVLKVIRFLEEKDTRKVIEQLKM